MAPIAIGIMMRVQQRNASPTGCTIKRQAILPIEYADVPRSGGVTALRYMTMMTLLSPPGSELTSGKEVLLQAAG